MSFNSEYRGTPYTKKEELDVLEISKSYHTPFFDACDSVNKTVACGRITFDDLILALNLISDVIFSHYYTKTHDDLLYWCQYIRIITKNGMKIERFINILKYKEE